MSDLVLEARSLNRSITLPGGEQLSILKDCSLSLRSGKSLAISGRSGSGKSTLLSMLGLLAPCAGGDVLIDGVSTARLRDSARTRLRRRHIGFIFQNFALLPHISVLGNVLLPAADGSHAERAAAHARSLSLLRAVGLDGRARSKPRELSGGEQQRVAIARSLINQPHLLLADEPTGSLDELTAGSVLSLLIDEAKARQVALIVVTHDAAIAHRLDDSAMLQGGCLLAPSRT
jgi:ABC-type lipoprotein export system ATPase subunit